MTTATQQTTTRTFDNTARALVEYDSTHEARQYLWNTADSREDVDAAEAADKEALVKVQEAFWEDTKDINSRENCGCVDVGFMRRMTLWVVEQPAAAAEQETAEQPGM